MQHPLVSIIIPVIIPVYNGSNFMREAIDSALAQTYPNIEILVVNDGSTDNTREIALSYGDKIRYFEKENGGVATALNLAIREMKGEYFSWLSHDDWYTPDKVEAEMEALRACGDMHRAVFSDCDFVQYPSGKRYRMHNLRYGKSLVETGWFAVAMGLISGCTLLIPKSYFDKFGVFDESVRAVNDYEQWFRMFKDRKLAYVDKSLVGSRVHEKQVTVTYAGMSAEEEQLWTWILEGLQDVDIKRSGLSLYLLYSTFLPRFFFKGWHKAERFLVNALQALDEPVDGEERRKQLKRKLYSEPSGVYVYCAGRVARRFLAALRWRGISVNGISDRDSSKWGTTFESCRCIPPSEIPKDAKIIVANAYPDEIVTQLKAQGFSHIETSESWDYDLLMTPIKKELCEVLQ